MPDDLSAQKAAVQVPADGEWAVTFELDAARSIDRLVASHDPVDSPRPVGLNKP